MQPAGAPLRPQTRIQRFSKHDQVLLTAICCILLIAVATLLRCGPEPPAIVTPTPIATLSATATVPAVVQTATASATRAPVGPTVAPVTGTARMPAAGRGGLLGP